jgi:hypothetical protein
MLNIEGKNVGSMMTGGKLMDMLVTAGKVIWQAIRALFFTKDGFYIETKDGKIFDSKQ